MAKIGELLVEVSAGTSGLRQEMKKAKEVVKQEGKQIEGSGRGMAEVFDLQGRKVAGFRDNLKKMNEPLEGVRSALGAVGIAGTEAVGVVGSLAQGFANVGGKAGVIGAALVGVGFAVSQIVDHMQEADRLAAKERVLGLDPDLIEELSAKFPELERASVVALAAAGKEAGLTKDDIVRLGEAARDEAEMSGKAFDEGLGAALKRVGVTADQVRAKARTFLGEFFSKQAGDADVDDEDFLKKQQAITDAEEKIEAAKQRIGDLQNGRVLTTIALRDAEIAAQEKIQREQRALIKQLQDDTDAILGTKEEIEGVLAENEPDKPKRKAGERGSLGSLNDLPNAVDLLNAATPGGSLPDATELLGQGLQQQDRDSEAARDAAMEKAVKDAHTLKVAQDRVAEANKDAAERSTEQWAAAGVSAAGQFAGAFKSFLDSKDPADLFGGILRAAAGIVSMIPGVGGIVGGGALGLIGGFFADGGAVRGPGTATSDSIPAMLSDGEYVLRAAAVKRIGVDTLDKINALMPVGRMPAFASGGLVGRGGSGASTGGMTVINNTMAFDAPSLDRNWSRAEGVQKQRFTNRQGGAMQSALRSAVLTPRSA